MAADDKDERAELNKENALHQHEEHRPASNTGRKENEMEIYTNQVKEWTDYENQHKVAVAAVKWLDKHLEIVHGKRERNVELTYGLPYTSSGEYAAIWNTNVDARSLSDLDLQFKGVALDKDNNPVIIWYMTDCDGWKYTVLQDFEC